MKLRTLILLAVTAALGAGSCRRAVEPRFAELKLDTVVLCGVAPCDLSYSFRTIENADRSEALSAIENANINYFFALEDFTGSAAEGARAFIERFMADNATDTLYIPDMRYWLSIASDIVPVDTLLVCTIRRESFTGGAHGMRSTEYHNYWTEGGYELTLSDLFAEEELPALNERIRAKLYEQYGAANDEELSQRGFFPEMIAPSENFEVTPTGIVFHYNPYDIACYAVGDIEVAFTREELGL